MFGDTVGRKGYLGAGREIFYRVAAGFALFCAHGDEERDLHFIGLPHLIADALVGKVYRYRH